MSAAGRWSTMVIGVLVTAFLVTFVAVPAAAQTGAIHVSVLSAADGDPLPGVTVTLTNEQHLIASTSVLSDSQGKASFPILRAGMGYAVGVQLPGFEPQQETRIRLRSNATKLLLFRMVTSLEERVRVVASNDVVDLAEVGASTRFSDDFIESLPTIGRFYQEVLPLTPGVNDADGDGNPNVHGSRSRDFRAEVSGVSNVDPLTGQWLSRVNPDTIEELEIIPLGAGVEFGRAQGGFARVIQKQGSNQFEATLNFLYRSSKLDGDGASTIQNLTPPPEFETIQPAIQVSGPLIRDKLWFRLSHENIKRQDPVNLLNSIEVTTFEQRLNADQITWQVSPRNKLAFQYQSDPLSSDGIGLSSNVPLESTRKLVQDGETWSLTWTAPQSARRLFEATLAWQDHSVDLIPTAPEDELIEQQCVLFYNLTALLRTRCRNTTTGQTSGPHFERSEDERQRFTLRTQATMFTHLFGQGHRLKLGFNVEEERYQRDLSRKPDITAQVFAGFSEPTAITSVRVALPHVSDAKAEGTSWAVFAEDQWKPRDNLSVTIGLRVDREEIDSLGREQIDPSAEAMRFNELMAADGRFPELIPRIVRDEFAKEAFTAFEDIRQLRQMMADAFGRNIITVRLDDVMSDSQFFPNHRKAQDIQIRNTNLSPRLSVAWDPWSNGKTKVAITAGRYFDKIFLAVPLVELEPIETTLNYSASLHFPGPPFFFENNDNFVTITPLSARMVDRNLRTPFQDEYSFRIERELWPETSISLTWLKRRFEDQLQDFDINQAPGDFGYCAGSQIVPLSDTSDFSGILLEDPITHMLYRDTDPGIGDGRIDDCRGDVKLSVRGNNFSNFGPDGRPDLYNLSPVWRELLMLGNFNRAQYDAIVFEVVRRLYRGWQLDASYTWSRAEGDAEDFDLLLGNEQNQRDDEFGFLDYDQRHLVKFNVATHLRGGWRVGSVIRWESGLPYSTIENRFLESNLHPLHPYHRVFVPLPRVRFPTGQRNDQRNLPFWTIDLRLAKEFSIGGTRHMGLSVEVLNLMNDDVLRIESLNQGENFPSGQLVLVPSTLTGSRRFGRRWQLGLRLGL